MWKRKSADAEAGSKPAGVPWVEVSCSVSVVDGEVPGLVHDHDASGRRRCGSADTTLIAVMRSPPVIRKSCAASASPGAFGEPGPCWRFGRLRTKCTISVVSLGGVDLDEVHAVDGLRLPQRRAPVVGGHDSCAKVAVVDSPVLRTV